MQLPILDAVVDRTRQNKIASRRTILRRFTGTEAMNGTAAQQITELLTAQGWLPRSLPADYQFTLTG